MIEERKDSYRAILDQALEFLSPIMPHDKIVNMPYKELLYEMERRRVFLEKNRKAMEQKQLEEQLKGGRTSNQNNRR